jgi:hypothetical protein
MTNILFHISIFKFYTCKILDLILSFFIMYIITLLLKNITPRHIIFLNFIYLNSIYFNHLITSFKLLLSINKIKKHKKYKKNNIIS